ncbi:MAG TPA: AbrB/MazE/SpoVT family DNA-binding domain-containing protein [Thermoplasmata archaeon]|nr:AbrB/MazE/SpoVT family DNA-binding domain-containing protein [Thermoplasmata archaeon]
MEAIVKVTRRGQTTIPVEIRRRLRIKEGTRLVVEARNHSIVMHLVANLDDLAGSMAKTSNRAKADKLLDEMERDEE